MESYYSLIHFYPLTHLSHKLNKYLINIIDQYYCININKLVNEKLNVRYMSNFSLNQNLTIEDIIVKCFHKGYKGFTIYHVYERLFKYRIDPLLNDSIKKTINSNFNSYSFKNDFRDLFFTDIMALDDVLIKRIEITKNE